MASFTGSSEFGGAKSESWQIISRLELVQVFCLVQGLFSLTTVSVLRQLNLKIPKFAQLAQLTANSGFLSVSVLLFEPSSQWLSVSVTRLNILK